MKTKILIIGAGLSGLTTAFRLASPTTEVSIVDPRPLPPVASSESPGHVAKSSVSYPFTQEHDQRSHALPIIIHGFQHATWSLLREITPSFSVRTQPVDFEFSPENQAVRQFKPGWAPAPFHALLGILLFSGLPFHDRWMLMKTMEQMWEEDQESSPDLDNQNALAWITMFRQSPQALQDIWNPLCHFFLGTSLQNVSAYDFKHILHLCFLSARRNVRTWTFPLDEEIMFLNPLRNHLLARNVTFYSEVSLLHFLSSPEGIAGIRLNNGTTLTADFYISTLPRKALLTYLPDRLLAKYAYFSHLTQLSELSTLVVDLETSLPFPRPRLLLSSHLFDWITLRPHEQHGVQSTRISCIATDKPHLLDQSDRELLTELFAYLSVGLEKRFDANLTSRIIRIPDAFLSCRPGTSVLRPLQQSPLPNFFLAGPWTDTGLPPSRESSIVSANTCATIVTNSLSTR